MTETPRELADAMHAFLMDLDPARTSVVTEAHRVGSLTRAQQVARGLMASWTAVEEKQRADTHLHQAVQHLEHALNHGVTPTQGGQWLDLRDHLAPFYEALVTALRRHGERVLTLHPTNYQRTAFHILSGVAVVMAFELLLTPVTAVVVAAGFCVVAWAMELVRHRVPQANVVLMKLFKPIARDHERYRVNSSTWYGTAMLIIAVTAPNKAGMLGIMALALGDPAAGWVGRKFGKFRIVGGKSVEGTLAFAGAALVGGLLYFAVSGHVAVFSTAALVLALVAAVMGALTELLATRVDDNLAVPVLTAWAVLLAERLLA
jgi:dolichol kinase